MQRLSGALLALTALTRDVAGVRMGVLTRNEFVNCSGAPGLSLLIAPHQECLHFGSSSSIKMNCDADPPVEHLFGTSDCSQEPESSIQGCALMDVNVAGSLSCAEMDSSEYVKFVGHSGTCEAPGSEIYDFYDPTGCAATSAIASQRLTVNATTVIYERYHSSNNCSGSAGFTTVVDYDVCVTFKGVPGKFVHNPNVTEPIGEPASTPGNGTNGTSTNSTGNTTVAPTSGAASTVSYVMSSGLIVMSVLASLVVF